MKKIKEKGADTSLNSPSDKKRKRKDEDEDFFDEKRTREDEEDDNLFERKKKKRKKNYEKDEDIHEKEVSFNNSEMPSTLEYWSPSKKHKKKKNKNDKIHKEDSFNDSEMSSSMEFSSPTKKRKKEKKKKDRVDLNESIDSLDSDEMTISPYEMSVNKLKDDKPERNRDTKLNRRLLRAALSQFRHTNYSYKVEWKKLDHHKIAEEVGITSAEECEELLVKLVKPTLKLKCLYQVIQETMIDLPRVSKVKTKNNTKYNTNFMFFVRKNLKMIEEAMKNGMGKNPFVVAAGMWNDLTDEERMSYYEKKGGKTPFDLYLESVQADVTIKVNEARTMWKNLPIEKKVNFIQKSATIMMQTEEQMENALNNKIIINGPSKEESRQYLEYLGMPKKPNMLYQIFYLKKTMDENEKLKNVLAEAYRRFSKLNIKQKCFWIAKHEQTVKDYDKNFQRWKNGQSEVSLYIWKLFQELNETASNNDKPKVIKEKKKLVSEFNQVEMPITRATFQGEPIAPPIIDINIYIEEQKKATGKTISRKEAMVKVPKLSHLEKASLKFNADKNRKDFIEKVQTFARSMHEDQRKMFIGIKRLFYFRKLNTDIFEKEFPDTEYPVYVKAQTPKSAKKTKSILNDKKEKSKENENKNTKKGKNSSKNKDVSESESKADEHLKEKEKNAEKPEKIKKVKKVNIDKLLLWDENDSPFEDETEFVKQNEESETESEENTFPDLDFFTSLDDKSVNKSLNSVTENSRLSSTVKMESDSDDENINQNENIQAFMNYLGFKKEDVTKEEEESYDDDYE